MFNPGDKVIFWNKAYTVCSFQEYHEYIKKNDLDLWGKFVTLEGLESSMLNLKLVPLKSAEGKITNTNAAEVILEETYNSPLYKAMKEEE